MTSMASHPDDQMTQYQVVPNQRGLEQPPHLRRQPSNRFTAMTALVPPKAKELLMAARMGRFRAQLGVTSRSHSGSSSSILTVGGTIPRRIASITAINSSAPLAPSACPCIDFVDEIDIRFASLPNTVLMTLISM